MKDIIKLDEKEFFLDLPFTYTCKDNGDLDHFTFEGMASTSDLDLGNDIVEPTAFAESIQKRTPALLWQHDHSQPLGVFVSLGITPEGLKVSGKMPLTDSFVRERVKPQMLVKGVQGLSIGYRVIEAKFDRETGIRTITKLLLFEISIVTLPMNVNSTFSSMKSYLKNYENTETIERINKREDIPKERAEKSHPWEPVPAKQRMIKYMADKDYEYFPEYCDIVDSKMVIIPRAVFEARVDMLKNEENSTEKKDLINILYKEMDLQPPFPDGSFCLTELKNISLSNLAYVMRYKTLSKDAAKYVTGLMASDNSGDDSGNAEKMSNSLSDIITNLKKITEA